MSGDVQPRKRKDKKKKKDDLSFEEPPVSVAAPVHPGTSAIFGEGDVFMHSYSDHGTGGHWCAKVIFFSLLAVLITLIGLIILENRGLSELEANAVESRYSGVLDGWLEDLPDDDHHDVHTLELNHPDPNEDDHDDDPADLDDDHEDEVSKENNEHEDEESQEDADDEEHDDDAEEDHQPDDEEDNEDDNNDNDEENDEDEREEVYSRQFSAENDEDEREEVYSRQFSAENDEDEREEVYSRQFSAENDEDEREEVYSRQFSAENDEDEQNYKQVSAEDDDEEQYNDEDDGHYKNEADEPNYEDDNNESSNEVKYGSFEEDEIENDELNDNDEEADDDFNETQEDKDEDDHDDDDHDDDDEDEEPEVELERIEREPTDVEPISNELPALPEADDDDDDGDDDKGEDDADEDNSEEESPDDDDDDFLQHDDLDSEPPAVVERITAPPGKPFQEVDDDSTEQPVDTLADEEEYEKRQEELRQEAEAASHLWLKLSVGGALVLATYAVVSKCAAPPPDEPDNEEEPVREATPLTDRRMTLIPEAETPPAPPKPTKQEPLRKVIQEEDFLKKLPSIIQSSPTPKQVSLEEEGYEVEEDIEDVDTTPQDETENKELYSEEEIEEEDEEIMVPKKEIKTESDLVAKKSIPKEPEAGELEEDNGDIPDDVEIIEDEELEEEEEDEEDISDVDDVELLSRLEAKYGRLPEPERFGFGPPKEGGNSVSDDWPGEPSDLFWREQLDSAEQNLRQGSWTAAAALASKPQLATSARARWVVAKAYDAAAEAKQDNNMLSRAIAAYLELLKMNERLSDKKLLEITERTLDRIKFSGKYLSAEPVYKLLIRRFPNDPAYRNKLTISFLMANRGDLAAEVLNETLKKWPNDPVALAHYAFVLKTQYNRYEEAVELFQKALRGDSGPAHEPRFFYHLGDSLLLLNRFAEAHEVHKRGAALGYFLSPAQRSLYNVNRLKGQPWWSIEETPYVRMARALEKSWKDILKEGEAARSLFEEEKEGLREKGEWSQLDIFARGREIPGRCQRAPVTCSIVRAEPAAWGCRRGQVKFSTVEPGTHIRPHVGPTNCRLRVHLGLKNTKDTFLRVDKETRQWRAGSVLIFDDSFEHEVWHNGSGSRLVLIVDVWHPQLTPDERRKLPPI